MLEFLVRKRVDKLMYRAYNAGYDQFKFNLRKLAGSECGQTDVERLRFAYQDDVSEFVSNFIFNFTDSKVVDRYRLACSSHSLAFPGFPDDQYCAGLEYCLAIYALTGKSGKAKDAVRHNHLFAAYVNRAIDEIEEFLGD